MRTMEVITLNKKGISQDIAKDKISPYEKEHVKILSSYFFVIHFSRQDNNVYLETLVEIHCNHSSKEKKKQELLAIMFLKSHMTWRMEC